MSEIEHQSQSFLAEYRRKPSIQVLTVRNSSIDQVWPEPDDGVSSVPRMSLPCQSLQNTSVNVRDIFYANF